MKIKISGICFLCGTIAFTFLPVNFYGICVMRLALGYEYFIYFFYLLGRSLGFLEYIFALILPLLHLIATTSFFLKKWSVYSHCLSGIIAWHLGIFIFFSHPAITLMLSTIFFIIARLHVSSSTTGDTDDLQQK